MNRLDFPRLALLLALPLSNVAICASESGAGFIAGTKPSQRPVGAPVITEFVKPEGWYTQALHGVERPYPSSLRFLEDQGAWHTPFNRPGMPDPYDLRGWHADRPD